MLENVELLENVEMFENVHGSQLHEFDLHKHISDDEASLSDQVSIH